MTFSAEYIRPVADQLARTQGRSANGASSGVRTAAALLLNRPEWSSCSDHLLDCVWRLEQPLLDTIIAMRRDGYEPPEPER